MRLTQVLNHAKYYYWGKGWGQKPPKDTSVRQFKIQWKAKSKRPIFECFQTLPEGVTAEAVEEPNAYVQKAFRQSLRTSDESYDKSFPWPYSQRPIKGMDQLVFIQ
jgi:hypothetical protein